MKSNKLIIIGSLTIIAILAIIVLWVVAIIGAMDLTDGCLYRYNSDGDSAISETSVVNSVVLKANGNYTINASDKIEGAYVDPNMYGKWLNTNIRLKPNQTVGIKVKGEVSLCKAYIPAHNLQQDSSRDENGKLVGGKLIEIPRVENESDPAINLIFNAQTDEWRNITQLFKNDRVVVGLWPDKKSSSGKSEIYNSLEKKLVGADCTEKKKTKQTYSPICGRYSLWDSKSTYVSECKYTAQCDKPCEDCAWQSCYKNVSGDAPEPYQENGKYTAPWNGDNFEVLNTNFNQDCRNNQPYVDGEWQNKKYFWFSADNATGLLYRFDENEDPTNKEEIGQNVNYSEIAPDKFAFNSIEDQTKFNDIKNAYSKLSDKIEALEKENPDDKVVSDLSKQLESNSSEQLDKKIKNGYRLLKFSEEGVWKDDIYIASDMKYLQYRFYDGNTEPSINTGGYVLNIKQTKCRRKNGQSFDDTMQGRGRVQYIIGDYGSNPNNDMSDMSVDNLILDDGASSVTAPSGQSGYLWLRIDNKDEDYKDSFGQYSVELSTTIDQSGFYHDVLDPFFKGFKGKIQGAAEQMFKNMTCYKGVNGTGDCTNFFNYVKGLLTLYIMIYGMMFLVGMVQISQTDIVKRVIKIGLVAGLLNESTFDFFNSYVFDFVTGFTDDIIANMAGYSIFSGSTSVSNPFMFLNEVMTKIFLSSTFMAQIMALPSMGLNGIIYFILVIVCLGIVVIVLLRSIAIYLMAFMAITVLIGLTPLFLTFILFEKTSYLFDNWVKFMFRYMLEPVILLAGIIILTQLFTIYLDSVIGYSVCWKCAIPIKLPFPAIPGLDSSFLDVELFCINWFAPWGFDHRSTSMGLNMQNIVILLMIVYCMWGYIDFSANIVGRLAGGAGGPSATQMGQSMSGAIESKALSAAGLDRGTRGQIKQKMRGRLQSLKEAGKKNPLDSGNRHDAKPPSEKGSNSGSGSASKPENKLQKANNPGGGGGK